MNGVKEFILSLTWVDFVILFGIIRGAHSGYRDGLIKEVLRLVVYVIALCVMIAFSGITANFVSANTFLGEDTALGLTGVALVLITYLVLKIITDLILKLAKLDNNFLLKITGLFAGCFRWAAILSLIFLLIDKTDAGTGLLTGSQWVGYVRPIAPAVLKYASGLLPGIDIAG